ncbi:MAG: hypothetical protein L6Q95_13015 [Planctomycetes bacterium]|nr:hypothetical protein [Planctomycetota bacterium]
MRRVLGIALLLTAAGSVRAGPPAICWPVEIGDAKSLPWGKEAFARDDCYDARKTVEDTLSLLDARMPVLVRMETLRRATIYLEDSQAGRDALLRALASRVLDAEAAKKPSALAWFDAGYAQGCFSQLREQGPGGYAWVCRAAEIAGASPEMEYGCAILSLMGARGDFKGHLDRAQEGADKSPLLARNLESLKKLYPPVLRYFEGKEKGMGSGKGKE